MVNTSASAQIVAAVKATLDGYDLPRISTVPTILTVKEFTINALIKASGLKVSRSQIREMVKEARYSMAGAKLANA